MTTAAALKAWATRRGDPADRDREAERQDDIVTAAEAVVRLVRNHDIQPGPTWKNPGNDQEFRYILSAIVRRGTARGRRSTSRASGLVARGSSTESMWSQLRSS